MEWRRRRGDEDERAARPFYLLPQRDGDLTPLRTVVSRFSQAPALSP